MDPVSLTAISLGTTALGGAVNAYGQYQSGQAKSGMYQYQSAVAQINSQIAKQNADYSKMVGETQAQAKGMETRYRLGQARVARGASGLDVNRGSNPRVFESIKSVGEHDAAVIRSDSAKRAYGYEVEAMNASAQGQVYRAAADDASRSGKIGAIGSILGTAGSVSSKWLDARTRGIFTEGGGSGYDGLIYGPGF